MSVSILIGALCTLPYILFPTAQCPELEPIENGFITYDPDMTPDFDIGTIAIHQCDPGFILVGAMFRNCTVGIDGTGEWNENPPTCERKVIYEYKLWPIFGQSPILSINHINSNCTIMNIGMS